MSSRNRSILLLTFLVLQAYLIRNVGGSLVLLAAALVIATVGVAANQRPLASQSSWSGALLFALAFVTVKAVLLPIGTAYDEFVFAPSWLTIAAGEFLILIQALSLIRKEDQHPQPNNVSILGLIVVFCAFNSTIELDVRNWHIVSAIALPLVSTLFFQHTSQTTSRVSTERCRDASFWQLAFCMVAAVLAWQLITGWSFVEPRLRSIYSAQLVRSAGRRSAIIPYVRSGQLGRILQEQQRDPLAPAVRVYCDRAPGYLRGHVFDVYDGEWRLASYRRRYRQDPYREMTRLTNIKETPVSFPSVATGGNVFQIRSPRKTELPQRPYVSMTIETDPRRGPMYFAPLEATYLQGNGDALTVDEHNVPHRGVASERYLVHAQPGPRPTELNVIVRSRLLSRPTILRPEVQQLANQVCANTTTTVEKVAAIEKFFTTNFSYDSQTKVDGGQDDPLSHFLLQRHPAHCEYFASGAAILLRLADVPTRYVTGYVVRQMHDEEDYWIGRNRNAHAWAEAYDDSTGRWIIVEATPGMAGAKTLHVVEDVQVATMRGTSSGDDSMQTEWMILTLFRLYRRHISGVAIGSICLFAIYLVWCKLRDNAPAMSPQEARLRRILGKMDRRMRRYKLSRNRSETLHTFAERIQNLANDDPALQRAAKWYINYAAVRYQSSSARDLPRLPT